MYKKRLSEIAKYVEPFKRIADIGCDHGYLIKEAFEKYNINYAQAIDNKIGPLNSAKRNLSNFKDNIDFSHSNGLDDLNENVDCIVISGMGGTLIYNILVKGIEKLRNVKRIILQANRNIDKIRLFCNQYCYKIVSEEIIYEYPSFYEIIVLEKGFVEYNNKEIMFGPLLIKEKSDIFINKWESMLTYYKKYNDIKKEEIKLIEEVLYENK